MSKKLTKKRKNLLMVCIGGAVISLAGGILLLPSFGAILLFLACVCFVGAGLLLKQLTRSLLNKVVLAAGILAVIGLIVAVPGKLFERQDDVKNAPAAVVSEAPAEEAAAEPEVTAEPEITAEPTETPEPSATPEPTPEPVPAVAEYKGKKITENTTQLNLYGESDIDEAELINALRAAPNVKTVLLPDADETTRWLAPLLEQCPDVEFVYDLVLLGRHFPSDTTVLDFGNTIIDNSQINDIGRIINMLPNITEIDLYESDLSEKNMDYLCETYPDIFFGFTVKFWNYEVRTDATAFSTLGTTADNYYEWNDLEPIRFCKKLKALDLGHNFNYNLDFVKYFPDLRVLIMADNRITDLSPLAECRNLEYVELFLNSFRDLTPLKDNPNLLDLNICFVDLSGSPKEQVEDVIISCKNLERCWLVGCGLSQERRDYLVENCPDVEFNFTEGGSTDGGWREHPRYDILHEMMRTRVYQPFN